MQIALCLEQTLGHRAHTVNLISAMASAGLDADVYRVEYSEGGRGPWAFRGSWHALRQIRRGRRRPDVQFFHTQSVSLFAPLAAFRRPYVVSVDATPLQFDRVGDWYQHGRSAGPMEWLKTRWYQLVLRKASALVAWSDWAADSLVSDYGVPRSRISVQHPGAPKEFFEIQRAMLSKEAPPTVLFVGGDLERKGGDLLLRALERIPELRAIFVTTDSIPPQERVEVIADATPGSARLLDAYRRADFFCLPTRGDCTPVVLGEAMAAGLPVITTRMGSNCETVAQGTDGLLIDASDEEQLVEALKSMTIDPAARARMGDAARAMARARFDANENARSIFRLLESVANK